MVNKPIPYFDDFVIIFKKDKTTEDGAKIIADVVGQDNNYEKDEFVDATNNDHKRPLEEIQEQNWEKVSTSTSNTPVDKNSEK